MRRRIYEIVQRAQPGDGVSRAYDIFIVVVAFLSIVPLMFKEMTYWLNMLDVVTVYILFLDYILRWMTQDFRTGKKGWKSFAKYPFTPLAIIDLLAILPSLGILPESFKFLRILRIVKMFRYSKNLMVVANVFTAERKTLLSVLFLAVAYIFLSGLVMFTNEPGTFDNFFDALYWATTALTTVGYGDVYPTTELGKAISMISSLFGIAVIALPAGIITGGFLEEVRKRQADGEAYYRRHDLQEFKGKPLSAYSSIRAYLNAHPKLVYYTKMIICGVLINIVFYVFVRWLNLPVWLDTTGTALVAFLLEPAAGLLVGYFDNLAIAVITGDAGNLLYYALSAIVALVYGVLFARGKKITAKRVLWAVFYLVVVSSFISTLLTYALNDGIPDVATEFAYWQTLVGWGMPEPLACFLALAFDRILDNLAVFALVFGLTRVMKRRSFAGGGDAQNLDETPRRGDANMDPSKQAVAKTSGEDAPASSIAGEFSAKPTQQDTRHALGIDVGGTNTKIGVFTAQGKLLGKRSFPTIPVRNDGSHVHMKDEFATLLTNSGVTFEAIDAIGLAVPGMILTDDKAHMLPNVDLDVRVYKSFLHSEFPHARVDTINDANAAILGDKWQGSIVEQQGENLVFVTLGTGVGAGVVVNGELSVGAHGAAGEVGHICVAPAGGRPCKCGRTGCLEQYASATGLIRTARELLEAQRATDAPEDAAGYAPVEDVYPDGKTIFDASMAGDPVATEAVDQFARYLGLGLSQLACMFDPEVFIIGGGLTGSYEAFLDVLREHYRECALPVCQDTPIVISKLGNDCGIYGAARHALLLLDSD